MRPEKFGMFLSRHAFQGYTAAATRSDQRLPYQIVILCREADMEEINRLLRQLLLEAYQEGQLMFCEPQVQGHQVRIVVRVRCTVPERSGLVRLVSRLGLEQGVRSVRWESVPTQLNS